MSLQHTHIIMSAPPVIEPFSFPRFLEEGSRAKILCSVIKGDAPITIRWLKDSRPLSSSPLTGISISTLDEFSSAIVISKVSLAHRGNYSCIASNAASSTNFTAEALVYGESFPVLTCLAKLSWPTVIFFNLTLKSQPTLVTVYSRLFSVHTQMYDSLMSLQR